MKRLLAVAIVSLAVLGSASCGYQDPENRDGDQGWYLTEPDSRGDVYECTYWAANRKGAIWCKPEPVFVEGHE